MTDENTENEIFTKIVGVTFEGRQDIIQTLKAGDTLTLKREPNNQHDPNAVAVLTTKEEQAGYLNRQIAEDFSDAMDRGVMYDAEVLEVTGGTTEEISLGCNIKITKRYADTVEKPVQESADTKRLEDLQGKCFDAAVTIYAATYNQDKSLFNNDQTIADSAAQIILDATQVLFSNAVKAKFIHWPRNILANTSSDQNNAPAQTPAQTPKSNAPKAELSAQAAEQTKLPDPKRIHLHQPDSVIKLSPNSP